MPKEIINKTLLAFATLCIFLVMPMSASAAKYTYTYTGNSFTYAGNSSPLMAYSEANRIIFSFTTENLIDPLATIRPTSWSFSDGTQTFTSDQGFNLNGFALSSAASSAKSFFSEWSFHLDASSSCEVCSVSLNTSKYLGQASDWAQNQLFNYAGNESNPGTWTISVSPVPEPSTYAMMLAGLGVVGFAARRKVRNLPFGPRAGGSSLPI